MLSTVFGALALILTGLASAIVSRRLREQATVRALLRAHHADLQARAERRRADAEAHAPRDWEAFLRELRRDGYL